MKVKKRIVIVLAAALAIAFGAAMGVYAADYEYVETDVSTPSAGCVMLGVYGSYHSDAQAALDRINEIRYEACTDGKTPDPRNSARKLTASDYVPIKWSTSLEKIARIRAVEGGIARFHVRHNGKGWSSVSYGGITSYGENLAYNYSTSMVYSVNDWYSEREDWVKQTQGEDIVTGHYTSLIDPSNTYVGLGLFESDAGPWPCNCAGVFTDKEGSLGTRFLDAPKNVMQKIEVKEAYINEYYINQPADLTLTGQQKLGFRVKDTVPGGYASSRLWVIDPVTWSSSNTGVVSVASDGTAKGTGIGTATVTARAGSKTATISIEVTCKHNYEFGEPDASGKCKGTCSICGDTISIVPPTQFTVFWRNDQTTTGTSYYGSTPSNNPNGSNVGIMFGNINGDIDYQDMVVETSDPVGAPVTKYYSTFNIGVQTAGLVDVYIYPKYNPSVKKTYTLRFGDEGSVNIGDAVVTLETLEYTYNGGVKKPAVSVTYNGKKLNTSDDYTVSYEDNSNAGTAKAIITGKGIWSGTVTKEYTINRADISGSTVTVSPTSYVCDGTPKEPGVTVRLSGKTLTRGTDYEVEYKDNIYLGTATVTVTGKGNYTGEKSANFQMTHSKHDYLETVNVAPTCTTAGSATYTCKVCKDSYDKTLPATGVHTPVTDAKADPTCTETGLTEGSHCSVCGNVITKQETIPALGHKAADPVHENEVAATCTEEGSYDEVVYCSACNTELSREPKTVGALGHNYKDVDGTAEAPTCTKAGKKADKKCSRCEDYVKGGTIAALGHTPADPVHEKEVAATCTEEGSYDEVVYCSACNAELSREAKTAEALGHKPGKAVRENEVAATCTEEGNYDEVVYCSACNIELSREAKIAEALGHRWGEWTETIAATETEEGEETRICMNDASHIEKRSTDRIVIEPGSDPNQKGEGGSAIGKGASAAAADKAITSSTSEEGPKGSVFNMLQLKSTKQTKTSVKLAWKKVKGARKYVIYGNACGKKNKMKKLGSVSAATKTFTKVAGKAVKKGTYYKFMVVALDSNNNVITSSKVVHVATKGGKAGNDKSVSITAKVDAKGKTVKKYKALSKTEIKKGKSITIKAKVTPQSKKLKVKKHRKVVFESSDPKIAKVNSKGRITAKAKGSCYIYAYAQDGVMKRVRITVR